MQKIEKFTLVYGLEHDGTLHFEGELRLPTMEDIEVALETAGEGASTARVCRFTWGRTVTALGTIPVEKINAELLAGLVDDDFGTLQGAENTLRKKRKPQAATPSE